MATNIPMNTLQKVVYRGTELNSFSAAGCEWRKPYTVTIPTVAGISKITVTRTASESNCGQVTATTLTSTGTVLYGDTLTVSGTPITGRENPTVTFSAGITSGKVTGNVTLSATAGAYKQYTVFYPAMPTGVASFKIMIQNREGTETTKVTNPQSSGSFSVEYGYLVYAVATASTGYNAPTISGVGTTQATGTSVTGNISVGLSAGSLKSFTVSYENKKAWVGSLQIYKNGSLVATAGSTNGSFTALYGDKVYAVVTAGTGYKTPTVNGISTNSASPTTVTGNISVTTTNNGFLQYTIYYPAMPTGVDSFVVYAQAQGGSASAKVSNPENAGSFKVDYGTIVYATATAASGYRSPTIGGVGTSSGTGTRITSNKSISLTAGVAYYMVSYPSIKAGVKTFSIYLNGTQKVSNPAFSGSFEANHGDMVYARAIEAIGYNAPTVGGVGTTSATATAITKNTGITLTAGSRKTYTLTFTNPSYGSWAKSSMTVRHGTEWSISGRTITFTDPNSELVDSTSTNTVSANTSSVRSLNFSSAAYGEWDDRTAVKVYDYSYTTPSIEGPNEQTSGTVFADMTFTASNSRANVTFTNALMGTAGTNSTYSGNHVWRISGTNTAGSYFIREFTTSPHGAQYYYNISRNSSATQATSNITFTPTVTRSVHTYAVSYPAKPAGVANFYIYKNGTAVVSNPSSASSFTASYGDTIYATATAASGYGSPTISGVGTSSASATTVNKALTISLVAGLAQLKAPVVNSASSWDYSYMSFNITNPNSVAVNLKAHFLCMSCSGDGDGECINGYYGVQTIAANSTATITYDVLEETGTTMCEDGVDYEFTFEKTGYPSSSTVTGSLDYMDYEFTVSVPAKPTGVAQFQVYRNGVVEISNPTAATSFMATYDDEICAIAVATTGYNAPTITGVSTDKANPTFANRKINIKLTAGLIKYYTITYPKKPTGVASFYVYVDGTMRVMNPTALGTISVPYGSKVYATATAASGYNAPRITGVGTTSATATTITSAKVISLKAGTASTPTLSAPILSQVSEDWDSDEGYLNYVNLTVKNPNSVAVTVYLTAYDGSTVIATHTTNIPANTQYNENMSVPDVIYSVSNGTVSGYCTASGYTNSPTTTVTFND